MKLKLSMLTATAALLLASPASADVTLHITGSTAFRSGTVTAIKNLMTFGGGQGYAYDGTSFTGASHHVFVGTVTGVTGVVTVKTSWNGAVAGVKALNNNTTATYFDYPATTGTVYTLSASGTASVNANNLTDTSTADIAMFDNTQSSTKYTGTALTQTQVGIIPFSWVASKDAPAAITNITSQQCRNLFKTGFSSAALFTNNNADADDQVGGTRVYAVGRDPLSGTRLDTFAESGIGIFTSVAQYQPSVGGTNTGTNPVTVNNIDLVPADATVDAPNAGENGFSSGGNLADLLRNSTSSVTDDNSGYSGKVCFISYLGEGDANRAVNGAGASASVSAGSARYLSYNGVSAFGGLAKSYIECTITNGSKVITFPATSTTSVAQSTTGLQAGQLVRSNNLPGDTIITSVDSATQITVSKNATTSSTGSPPNGALSTSIINPTSIWNGSYTFWGYEYIAWRTSLAGDKLTYAGKLKDQIKNIDYFAAGLSILPAASGGQMRVARTADGGTVSQNY